MIVVPTIENQEGPSIPVCYSCLFSKRFCSIETNRLKVLILNLISSEKSERAGLQ